MLNNIFHSLLWLVVLCQGVCIFVLIHKVFSLQRIAESGAIGQVDRIPRGTVAPKFRAVDIRSGQTIDSSSWAGGETALFFVSSSCSACKEILKELASYDGLEKLVVIATGAMRSFPSFIPRGLPKYVPFLHSPNEDGPVSQYNVPFTPVVVILDAKSRIGSYRYPSSSEHIVEYLSGFADSNKVQGIERMDKLENVSQLT